MLLLFTRSVSYESPHNSVILIRAILLGLATSQSSTRYTHFWHTHCHNLLGCVIIQSPINTQASCGKVCAKEFFPKLFESQMKKKEWLKNLVKICVKFTWHQIFYWIFLFLFFSMLVVSPFEWKFWCVLMLVSVWVVFYTVIFLGA